MPSRVDIRTLDLRTIKQEIARRQRKRPLLERRRAMLKARLDRIDIELAELGASLPLLRTARHGPGKGRRGETSLPAFMRRAMEGKQMRAGELTKAVLALGYRTVSPLFPKILHDRLNAPGSAFKRLGRGLYTLK